MQGEVELYLEPAITGAFCVTVSGDVIFEGETERGDYLVRDLSSNFSKTDFNASDITKIFTSTGPGGFTGTRVGLATVQGLMRAGNATGFGIDLVTLLHLSTTAADIVVISAGKKDVLVADRDSSGEYQFIEREGLENWLAGRSAVGLFPESTAEEYRYEGWIKVFGKDILKEMIDKKSHFEEDISPVYGRQFQKK